MATLYVDSGSFENLTVTNLTAVTSSITYITSSQFDIQNNIVTVNTLPPTTRFGGLAVIDSGSSPQVSGSILFDSLKNQWIFVHQSTAGAAITSSVFIQGPQTFNNVGNETTLTTNKIPKATGGDLGEHIGDSNITDSGTLVTINSDLSVVGNVSASTGFTGSLFGTASNAATASVAPSYAPLAAPTFITYSGGNQATTSTTFASVHSSAGFSNVAAGFYQYEFYITYDAAATSTGARFGVSGSANFDYLSGVVNYTVLSTDRSTGQFRGYDAGVASPSSVVTTGNAGNIQGAINVTATGDLLLRFSTEVNASAITVTNVYGYLKRLY